MGHALSQGQSAQRFTQWAAGEMINEASGVSEPGLLDCPKAQDIKYRVEVINGTMTA